MKAIIPAAGLGTRFLPATKAQPKEMLPVVDTPVIQYVVEEAVNSGIDDILIITGRGKRAIEDHFDKSFELEHRLRGRKNFDLLKKIENNYDIHYVRQKEPKGLGDAIYYARKHVNDEPFAVLLGDDIIKSEVPCIKQLMNVFDRYESSIMAVEEVQREKISSYGIIDGDLIDKNLYLIKDLIEKPKPEEAPSNIGTVGRYVLTPEIFDCIKETSKGTGNEIQLTDALRILNKKQKIYGYKFEGERYDVGDKFGYMRATLDFALERKDLKVKLENYLREIALRKGLITPKS